MLKRSVCTFLLLLSSSAAADLDRLRRDFLQPPADCRPHTRWWWMGNALRLEDISFQLAEMQDKGIGGVEQISMGAVYEKGNHPYLSKEYFDLLGHAVREAKARGMEVSLNFGGPGWIWGGEWVPKQDRNKNMVASSIDLQGPQAISGELPLEVVQNPRNPTESLHKIRPEDRVLAVVAARIAEGRLVESSLTDLTSRVQDRLLEWQVPPGRWRVMAFWLVLNETGGPAVDHLGKAAMERYCKYLGDKYLAAVGSEFGKTIESLFMDSFEVPVFRNGLYWSTGFLAEFRKSKGYGLARYLPALWWEVGEISPKIRYDVNEFLHQMGIEAFFKTFVGWCQAHGVKARIQPYGFVTDILEGAGLAHIPEIEITAGEKDAVPWFDMRIGPRIYPASGAHLYGRNVVTVEAYTYQHWQPGRETLEELKISGDMFLRAGANKFYNSGYNGTPEMDFVPSRRFGADIVVSHVNTWWPYYRHLSDYVARCSVMLRQGRPAADVAVYSPLANQWTMDVLNARRWTRDFDWGDLGKLLVANGYDFDLINDDVLQKKADLSGGRIRVRDLEYRILILPNIQAMPLESLQKVQEYARGGGAVIALEQTPKASTGLARYRERDAAASAISAGMFRAPQGMDGTGEFPFGSGRTYFIRKVINRRDVLDTRSSAYDPFVNTLRRHLTPDFGIDFVREAIRENNGLIFAHRKGPDREIYFVTNVQDRPVDTRVAFRVTGKAPEEWNPYNGEIRPLVEYEEREEATVLPVRLAPYESTIIVFTAARKVNHVLRSDFRKVLSVGNGYLEALAERNGNYQAALASGLAEAQVLDLPASYEIAGAWRLALEGKDLPRIEKTMSRLVSWTEDPATRHFSGTGAYSIEFFLPASYIARDLELQLSVGEVGNVAEVVLNGAPAGVIWMRGQTLDITRLARGGRNSIAVQVTNTLINRVAGWKAAPPLPPHLAGIYGRGLRDGEAQVRHLYGFKPLPRSGLFGPVVIQPLKKVRVPLTP